MNDTSNLAQSLVIQTITSFFIGYPLLIIAYNPQLFQKLPSRIVKIIVQGGTFFLIGVIASELEMVVRNVAFKLEPYRLFGGGGIYVFNGVISLILGYAFWRWLQRNKASSDPNQETSKPLTTVPVKEGKDTILKPLETVSYFEAYDNYSYIHDDQGSKTLCDYSLAFLENKLGEHFKRVHRKYIVNTQQIKSISHYSKGRYLIQFKGKEIPAITSSESYTRVIKALIKL